VDDYRAYYEREARDHDRRTASPAHEAERRELGRLARFVAGLPACRVLDVACGTGTLTQHVRARLSGSIRADRVFTSSFYSHLPASETRRLFVGESLRVAPELIVVEVARRQGQPARATELQVASDGQRYAITKRFWAADELARELDGSVVYDQGFIAVRLRGALPA
jgi:hypothetical protein